MADGQGDEEWLRWAAGQITEADSDLQDGGIYEERVRIFSAVIECFCDNTHPDTLTVKANEGLAIMTIVKKLQPEMPWVHPKTVAKVLRKLGMTTRQSSGNTKLYTSEEQLKEIAREIGYEDDALV
jgi:hypothetical protein